MATDRRKKGCPNENCVMNIDKVFQSVENDYCPKCGTKLNYVCEKCFKEIEDISPKHRKCSLCEAAAEEKKAQMADTLKAGAGKVFAGAAAVAGVVGAGFIKEAGKEIPKAVVKKVLGNKK